MKTWSFEMDGLQDRANPSVNGTGTSGKSDTRLTQPRSADVLERQDALAG
jgi:hypothetical protein